MRSAGEPEEREGIRGGSLFCYIKDGILLGRQQPAPTSTSFPLPDRTNRTPIFSLHSRFHTNNLYTHTNPNLQWLPRDSSRTTSSSARIATSVPVRHSLQHWFTCPANAEQMKPVASSRVSYTLSAPQSISSCATALLPSTPTPPPWTTSPRACGIRLPSWQRRRSSGAEWRTVLGES